MKILLTTLNSQYVHSNPALRYLYTVLINEKADVEMREFTVNNEMSYIYNELVRANYDLVCFSCYLWNIEHIKKLGADLKKASPGTGILLGGPEVSFESVEFMKQNPWCDFIIKGEGEYAIYRLVRYLTGIRLSDNPDADEYSIIPGLVYRRDDRIFVNEETEPMDFNKIPFLYSILEPQKDKVVYYESSRGCPYRCSYCMSCLSKNVRALDVERVRREISYFLYHKVFQVKFIDRTFNYDKERAHEILRYIIQNDNGVTNFHFELCGDLIDETTLYILSTARKGLFELEIGIQSTNPKTLKAVNRNENVYPVLDNIEKIIKLGACHVHVDLIAGLPYENYDSFRKSFDKVYNLKADAFQMGFLKVLKGTPIKEQAARYGIIYRDYPPYEVIATDYITAEDMVHLKMIDNLLDIFYNRGGFEKTLGCLITAISKAAGIPSDSPFRFFSMLSEYYYANGFQHRDRRKDDQYRILHGFIVSLDEAGNVHNIKRKALPLLDMDAKAHMDELNYRRFLNKGWEIQ